MALINRTCRTCGTTGYAESTSDLLDVGWTHELDSVDNTDAWICAECEQGVRDVMAITLDLPLEGLDDEAEGYDLETSKRFLALARDLYCTGRIAFPVWQRATEAACVIEVAVQSSGVENIGSHLRADCATPEAYEAL